MDTLLLEFQSLLVKISIKYKRYLFDYIDLNNRLIAIKGARGSGKTTLLLQIAKQKLPINTTLYVSLDHIYFYENNLYDLAKEFELYGGSHLLLDEVHKYPNWSREIKLIYDNLPNLNVIITSSSILELHKSESDLSRRMVSYNLNELSFREFILFEKNIHLDAHTLHDLLKNHHKIASSILEKIKPIPMFQKYLEIGVYPFFIENEDVYLQKLMSTINMVIEVDVNTVENINYETLINIKKLLKTIATSAPFTPNISKLSSLIGLNRNQLVLAIQLLERARIVNTLFKNTTGIGVLTKPEKLYLNNTNLMYALSKESVEKGNLRETFFLNQLKNTSEIHLSEKVDFLINNKYHFEVGGKNKKRTQIKDLENAYVVKDDIEIGVGNIIPLWLFGFLY